MCELWKKKGLNPAKVVGITTLDVVRANKFVNEITGAPMDSIDVPVIGSHAGTTILPVFSQCKQASKQASNNNNNNNKKKLQKQ